MDLKEAYHMKSKAFLITAVMLFMTITACRTLGAEQPIPDSSEYGKVLFCDDFSSYSIGENIVASSESPAFVSDTFTERFGTVKYGNNGDLYTIADYNGERCLKIGQNNKATTWPQFFINFSKPLTDGIYTLVYTVRGPASSNGVKSASIRVNFKRADGTTSLVDFAKSVVSGLPARIVGSASVGGTGSGCDFAFIPSFLVFLSCDNTKTNAYVYIDDLVLYGKTDKVTYTLPDGTEVYDFFAAGDEVTLAGAGRFYDGLDKEDTVVGFSKDGVTYPLNGVYQTASSEHAAAFTVLTEKKTYPVYYDLDARCGTLAEDFAFDGEALTLPACDADGFLGWEIPFIGFKAAGERFVFRKDDLREYLDADGRLTVKAVFETAPALFAPSLPVVFGGSQTVTVGELVDAAVSIRNSVTGESRVYPASEEARIACAVEMGLLDEAYPYGNPAAVADAVRVLANTLPARFYERLTGDDFAIGANDPLRPFADKLFRAGILPKDAILSDPLTGDTLEAMLEALVNRNNRSITPTRTIYVFGDSLCDPSPSYNSWVEKLRAHLDGNINVVNYAVGGYNAGSFVNADSGYGNGYDKFTDMLTKIKKGDYVFVALGTNDATLWMWKDHPELASGGQQKDYNDSRDDYQKYTDAARRFGAVPVYIVPVGRNVDKIDASSYSWEYDARIVTCMEDANAYYDEYTPIVNFKDVTDALVNEQMTAAERAAFYKDSVHYTDAGAETVAQVFRDLIVDDDRAELSSLRSHLTAGFDLTGGVTLFFKDGDETLFTAPFEDGETVDLSALFFERPGYVFSGWSLTPGGDFIDSVTAENGLAVYGAWRFDYESALTYAATAENFVTVTNRSDKALTLSFVYATKDSHARLTGVRVFADKEIAPYGSVTLDFLGERRPDGGETVTLAASPDKSAPFLGMLYTFEDALRPVYQPLAVVLSGGGDTFIDGGELF